MGIESAVGKSESADFQPEDITGVCLYEQVRAYVRGFKNDTIPFREHYPLSSRLYDALKDQGFDLETFTAGKKDIRDLHLEEVFPVAKEIFSRQELDKLRDESNKAIDQTILVWRLHKVSSVVFKQKTPA